MNSEFPKSNVKDLQSDVIELLKDIDALMSRASCALTSDSMGEKYGEFQKEVNQAIENVTKLQLRMAVVAPMKAGKSTITNAVVGQDILPSRNAAMTTLPTEIVLNSQLTQPTLTLSPKILSVFQETFLTLQQIIQELGPEGMQKKIEQYPHLTELSQSIEAGIWEILITPKISGRDNIVKALTGLNDIVRLCSLIAPNSDPLRKLVDVPCIETPFWRSKNSENSEQLGNLVIIDTPGPNEAGENLKLRGVVEEELRKSSIVLIVLDFTQLKTDAAEKVKKDVQKVIDLRGKENLYVLINKVDQRRDGDMTPEQVRKFVSAEFGIGSVEDKDRVFEIAARRAFVAASFIQELEQKQDLELIPILTKNALAQEVYGIDWEDDLENATIEELSKKAQRLWKKSGFDPFLEQAIKALVDRAAPRCMNSALTLIKNRLVELRDDMSLRNNAIAHDRQELQREVKALESDLQSLENCRSRLQQVDSVKVQLNQRLQEILEDLKKKARVSLENYFEQEEFERGDSIRKLDIKAREWLLKPITDSDFFPEWISRQIKSTVEFKSTGIFECKTEAEAEQLANSAISSAKERADTLLAGVRQEVNDEVEKARTSLTQFLEKETTPIVERARQRLNQAFNVNLSLPKISLDNDGVKLVEPRVKASTREIDQGYEQKTIKKRSFWHWLWLIEYDETIRVKKPLKKEDYYTVSLKDLIIEINQSIEAGINKINQGINKYLDEDFKERFDQYFDALEAYLGNYKDSLQQAQADQNLTLEKQEELKANLESLLGEAKKYIEKVDESLDRTNQLKF
ncbi:MAG TPA: dynamin family protein [Candidatus Obscuribacterales bacterium]